MATLDQMIDDLITQGVDPETIAARARARASESTKQYFLGDLMDPNLDPQDYAVTLTVSNWASLLAFFRKPTTETYHPQRIFQDIIADIQEAVATRNAQKLILSLLLGAKAVQP